MKVNAKRALSDAAIGFDRPAPAISDFLAASAPVLARHAAGPVPAGIITGTGNTFGLSTLVPTGASDVTFSADQTKLYIAMRNGDIQVFDVATGAKLATWDVGNSIGAISLSEDGSFLLATERQPASGFSTLYKIATANADIQTFNIAGGAFYDVEIVNGSTAIITGGQEHVTRFDLNTSAFSSMSGAVYYSNTSVLVEDTHLLLFAEPGISNAPLYLYSDVSAAVVASGGSGSSFNFGIQAVSEAAGLVVQFVYFGSFNVYGLDLQYQRNVNVGERLDGLLFDASGQYLYAYLIDSGVIAKFRVSDWEEVDSYAVGTSEWHNNLGYGDQLRFDATGKILTIMDNSSRGQVQITDLSLHNESFAGTAGADAFAGGNGNDVYYVNDAGDMVIEAAHEGNRHDRNQRQPHARRRPVGRGPVVGAERRQRRDRSTGNDLGQELRGNAGDNVLRGLGGNDVLRGGGGTDQLYGGLGNDVYYIDDNLDQAIELAAQGDDRVVASISYALLADSAIEALVADDENGTAALNLTGNQFSQAITGNAGANVLIGGAGSDVLDGKAGIDTTDGGLDNDVHYIDDVGDIVVERPNEGSDTVYARVSYALGADVSIERLEAVSAAATTAINLTGNALTQTITGNAGANVLDGGAGGADTLTGLGGDDTYIVDPDDIIVEAAGAGTDYVAARVSYTLAAGLSIELLGTTDNAGTASINLTGNELARRSSAMPACNALRGGGGADMLAGLGGDDTYLRRRRRQVREDAGGGFDYVVTGVPTRSMSAPRSKCSAPPTMRALPISISPATISPR